MDKENEQRRVKQKYANAKNVLPPELLGEVQKHFTGMMWVPAHTQFFVLRRRLVLALKAQGVSAREIAKPRLEANRCRHIPAPSGKYPTRASSFGGEINLPPQTPRCRNQDGRNHGW